MTSARSVVGVQTGDSENQGSEEQKDSAKSSLLRLFRAAPMQGSAGIRLNADNDHGAAWLQPTADIRVRSSVTSAKELGRLLVFN